MLRDDAHWSATADLFSAAPLTGEWAPALDALADACGGHHGQLIGVRTDATVAFNWMPRADPAAITEFIAIKGGDPQVNPRVRVGLRAPVMQAWHEAECSTDDELRRNFAHADWCLRNDVSHGSQATLVRDDQTLISLAVGRPERHGLPDTPQRRAFESLAGVVRAAVKTEILLEGRGADLLAGALGGLAVAAFICDGMGAVRALTAEAETVLRRGILQVRRDRLCAAGSGAAALEAAIDKARSGLQAPAGAPSSSVVLRRDEALEVLDIVALPGTPHAFGFEPRLLVVARGGGRERGVSRALMQTAFGLTPAESAIALQLAEGESTDEIAADRMITVSTLRSHIKAVFCKIGVNRRAELVARLRAFR